LFGSYDQNLYCLAIKDGSLIWKRETEGYIHGTPAVLNGDVIVTGCDGYLRVFRIQDGAEKMKVNLGAYVGASPAAFANRVFVGTFGNEVLCIDLQKGNIVWRYENPNAHFPFYSSAAITGQMVIVGGRDKMLHALDPESGKALWTFRIKSKVDCSPVIVGGKIAFGTVGGELFLLDAATGKEIWKFEGAGGFVSSPSVAEGKLVISSNEGTVYCFGKAQIS